MTRSGRMKPVQQVIGADERREARQLVASEERLAACERKLEELRQYEQDYRQGFNARAASGMGGHGLRDYQIFLARLTDAIRQQTQIVGVARAERDAQHGQWRAAAQRHKGIEHVVENWQAEERRRVAHREQRDSDERAQRKAQKRAE